MKASDLMGPLSEWIEAATLRPLAERCAEIGVCHKCHTKTLVSKHIGGEIEWLQCSTCLRIVGLPERRLVG